MKWRNRIGPVLKSAPLQLACRLILGGIFMYASLPKIQDPAAFAGSIAAYRILPSALIHPAALVMPWIELLCGLFLIAGFLQRGAVWLITLMLLVFMAATLFNALRGINIACGCFGSSGKPEPPLLVLLRDIAFLIPALLILIFGKPHRPPRDRQVQALRS